MTKRLKILFVDDEPRLLEGLTRLFRPMRDHWEVITAIGGMAGMAVMEATPADVVISDMRMPGMDGAEFLSLIAQRWPQTIRMILSGQFDRESMLRSIAVTHQYLAKPCNSDSLRSSINRACALRERLTNPRISMMVGRIQNLPSLPEVYHQIISELRSPEPSTKRVADVIAKDIGLTAKFLQLVNSARFGLNHHVTNMQEVVDHLGIDLMRQLVLASHVYGTLVPGDHSGLSSTKLWRYSQNVGSAAQAIARSLHWSVADVSTTYTAGLLHDCGRLLLAVQAPLDYAHVHKRLTDNSVDIFAAEMSVFGAAHPDAGAYLLGLWGLSDPLVEAVAYHHCPNLCLTNEITPLSLVHVAQAEVTAHESGKPACLDMAYLDRCQATSLLSAWQNIIHTELAKSAN
jgi:HD-like signal output (HDOD) protein